MNLLEIMPGIKDIIDELITSDEEAKTLKLKMMELDVREVEARLGVQKAWLGNSSTFVSGAIPTILWMVSVVILFNHILAPLLQNWLLIPSLDLPEWYISLAKTIVIGLFAKKAIDDNEIWFGGNLISPAKSMVKAAMTEGETTPVGSKLLTNTGPAPKFKAEPIVDPCPKDYDARIQELAQKYGITSNPVKAPE